MQNRDLPETYMGYSTKDLLTTWVEIQQPKGTQAPREQILVMRRLLRDYKLGLFETQPKEG
jgi:hypothetical protein